MFDKRLLALLGKDRKYVVYIVICNLLTTVSNIVITMSICRVADRLLKGGTAAGDFLPAFFLALGAVLVRYGLTRASGHFGAVLGSNAKEMLRRRIYEKVSRLGVRETDDLSLASLTQVGIEGVEQLDLYYSTYIPQFFYAVLSPFVLFGLLMNISVPSAAVLLCCVPLIPMSIIAVSRYAKKIFARYWGQYTKMGDAFLDNISGMKELKIFGADGRYHKKMNEEAEEFRKITMKVLTMQLASTTIMDLVAYGGAALGIAAAAANRDSIRPLFQMSAPALLLFVVLTAVDFFLPLRALGSAFHVSMNGATAGRKILTLLDTPEPVWGTGEPDGNELALTDVCLSYDGKRQILDHVSLTAAPGRLTAVVGQSGCGKSTVIALLSGIRAPGSGTVTMGGKQLCALSRDACYARMGIVSYDTYLFCDSVRENFRMADPDISDEKAWTLLEKVNLADFIRDSGGLDLMLKEGSVNISGGQRQRLALAVSLAAEKEIWCFDEMTSNIDAVSEEIIMKNIRELAKEKTVLLVSHRLRNVMGADRIYVLDSGHVTESGTHEALLASGGLYSRLFRKQQALEEGYKEVQA